MGLARSARTDMAFHDVFSELETQEVGFDEAQHFQRVYWEAEHFPVNFVALHLDEFSYPIVTHDPIKGFFGDEWRSTPRRWQYSVT